MTRAPSSGHGRMTLAWVVSIAWFACGACGASDGRSTLIVFAASSLSDAFADMERAFEAEHPDIDVQLTTAGSQTLRLQIEQGAAVDVFASANREHVDALVAAGQLADAVEFARNRLVIAVPRDNPAGLRTFADLPDATRIVVGAPDVPIGRYTREVLNRADAHMSGFRARVEAHIVSMEPNVRLVLSKIELGEADAAVVYRTDVTETRSARIIDIPPELCPRPGYYMGKSPRAENSAGASAWLALVASRAGRAVLVRHGFLVDRP